MNAAGGRRTLYLATVAYSTAYGATFLLPLRAAGIGADEAYVGAMLGAGMVSALVVGFFCGHAADRFGRIPTIILGGAAQTAALALIALLGRPDGLGLLAGICLGAGWAVFYLLAPLFAVATSAPADRVRVITTMSGLMMMGFGLGPTAGRGLLLLDLTPAAVFAAAAGLSALATAAIGSLRGWERQAAASSMARLTIAAVARVLQSPALAPTVMIGIGGSIFGCLTSYQTTIAAWAGVDFALFFQVFVPTVVAARLGLAGRITMLKPYPTVCVLLAIMTAGLAAYAFIGGGAAGFALTTLVFGASYGLAYSMLNGIVASMERADLIQSAMLVFPLAYFAGLYGFPFIGGWVIATWGVATLLPVLVLLGLMELAVAAAGWRSARRT